MQEIQVLRRVRMLRQSDMHPRRSNKRSGRGVNMRQPSHTGVEKGTGLVERGNGTATVYHTILEKGHICFQD